MKVSFGLTVVVLVGTTLRSHAQQGRPQEIVKYSIKEQRAYSMAGAGGTPAQLRNYFAKGTVAVGDTEMKVVGGILLDRKPVLWVRHDDLSRERRLVSLPEGGLPPLPAKNGSIGLLGGVSRTGVRFADALFMCAAPAKGHSVQQDVPLFFFYLSPLSGAVWGNPEDTPPEKSLVPHLEDMEVTTMLPDLYAYQASNKAGQIAWTRRPHFVGAAQNYISGTDLVRIEEVELPCSTQVGNGLFVTKVVIALHGLEGAIDFPDKVGKPLALRYGDKLAKAYEWHVQDEKGMKSRLLRQDVESSDNALAVYENGIVLNVAQLLETLRESIAAPGKAINDLKNKGACTVTMPDKTTKELKSEREKPPGETPTASKQASVAVNLWAQDDAAAKRKAAPEKGAKMAEEQFKKLDKDGDG